MDTEIKVGRRVTPEPVRDFFAHKFKSVENLARDCKWESEAIGIERASFSILAALRGGSFPPFIENGKKEEGRWLLELRTPIELLSEGKRYFFSNVEVHSSQNEFNLDASVPNCIRHSYSREYLALRETQKGQPTPFNICFDKPFVWRYGDADHPKEFPMGFNGDAATPQNNECLKLILAANKLLLERMPSLYELCAQAGPRTSVADVFDALGGSSIPYAPFDKGPVTMKPDQFFGASQTDDAEEREIRADVHLSRLAAVRFGEDWKLKTIHFKAESGLVKQKVLALYNLRQDICAMLPYTRRWFSGQTAKIPAIIPLDRQPLYNLDAFKGLKDSGESDQKPTVILTDNPLIAALNEGGDGSGFLWTSWICDDALKEPFSVVDWSPLEGIGPVLYLMTQHSMMSLAEAVEKAKRLKDYLKSAKEGGYKIDLRFVLLDVEFPSLDDVPYIKKAAALMGRYVDALPNQERHVEIIESEQDFERLCAAAEKGKLKRKFYAPESEALQEEAPAEDDDPKPADYLLRPVVARKSMTTLFAPSGHGKSAFAMSLAGAITGRSRFLHPKWWSSPLPELEKGQRFPYRKTLYFDFEIGAQEYSGRIRSFVSKYCDEEAIKNFLIEDMKKLQLDFSKPENQAVLFTMIEAAKDKGVKGQPVDLVVFDTVPEMIGDNNHGGWTQLHRDVICKLFNMNIAVIAVFQASTSDPSKLYGPKNPTFKSFQFISLVDVLDKNEVPTGVLRVSLAGKKRSLVPPVEMIPFHVAMPEDGQQWAPCNELGGSDASYKSNDELQAIYDYYTKRKYIAKDIYALMGMPQGTFYDNLKKPLQVPELEAKITEPPKAETKKESKKKPSKKKS